MGFIFRKTCILRIVLYIPDRPNFFKKVRKSLGKRRIRPRATFRIFHFLLLFTSKKPLLKTIFPFVIFRLIFIFLSEARIRRKKQCNLKLKKLYREIYKLFVFLFYVCFFTAIAFWHYLLVSYLISYNKLRIGCVTIRFFI